MVRRTLGTIMILTGILGLYISFYGFTNGIQMIDSLGASIDTTLGQAIDSLSTTQESLALLKTTVGQVNQGMETVQSTAINVSQTISDTRPLLVEVSQVTTEDIPTSIEAVQLAVPTMAESAAVIDDVLTTLSSFNFKRTILGIDFQFDLGVDYNPDEPFDVSVNRLGSSLEGIPEELRDLDVHFEVTNDNLATISEDIETISTDLATINQSITDIPPLVDEYIVITTDLKSRLIDARGNLNDQLASAKRILTWFMVWFALVQLVPLSQGYEFVVLNMPIWVTNRLAKQSQDAQEKDNS